MIQTPNPRAVTRHSVDFPSSMAARQGSPRQETPPSEWWDSEDEQEPMQVPVEEEEWVFDQPDQKADDQQYFELVE